MRRLLLAAICCLLLPALAQATAYSVALTGDAGSGFATISVVGDDIDYNILVSGIDPTTATLTDGNDSLDLGASFVGGSAFGSVTDAGTAAAILSDPPAWSLEISDGNDTISGVLSGNPGASVALYLPVVATIAGEAGTDFHTDGRLVNRSGGMASVTLEYYPEGSSGNSGPSATYDTMIANNEQLVLDDMATELFGVTDGKGAVRVVSDREIFGGARVYNDQISAGEGTFGQYVKAISMDEAFESGTVCFLSNEDPTSGTGFRANIGWFNPNSAQATMMLTAWDTDGTYLGEVSRTVAGLAQQQFSVGSLFSFLSEYGDFYVTFTCDEPIFVYGTLNDNVNGDAIYIAADMSN
jgi:hypothetical protein